MISIYKDEIKDALYPKKGIVNKKNADCIEIKKVKVWTKDEIKRLRKFLQLSQSLFASLLGVNLNTVISWENGRNIPSDASARLMEILKEYPDCLLEANIVKFKN